MRIASFLGFVFLCGCASQAPQSTPAPQARHADPEKDRAECLQQATIKAQSGSSISFGGRNTNYPFVNGAAFTDCIVARGYRPDDFGNFLAVPDQQPQRGN
jgi:hypothetical protein